MRRLRYRTRKSTRISGRGSGSRTCANACPISAAANGGTSRCKRPTVRCGLYLRSSPAIPILSRDPSSRAWSIFNRSISPLMPTHRTFGCLRSGNAPVSSSLSVNFPERDAASVMHSVIASIRSWAVSPRNRSVRCIMSARDHRTLGRRNSGTFQAVPVSADLASEDRSAAMNVRHRSS